MCGMLVLHLLHAFVPPPSRYPHLHLYAIAGYGCIHFVAALLYMTLWQWTLKDIKSKRE